MVWQYSNHLNAGRITRSFRRKIGIALSKGNFTVKTIENATELEGVLRLRYDVFHREYQNKRFPFGLDLESHDLRADHLAIIDSSTGRIVGTYRLLGSAFARDFYSETEFSLQRFLSLPGEKLELSRACIHRDYRRGFVMNLLWRGLMEYIKCVGAHYLFGCASIKTMDPQKVAQLTSYLEQDGHVTSVYEALPLAGYQLPQVRTDASLPATAGEGEKEAIPPLLKSYLNAGAKVSPVPALDRDFQCIDYFTVLRMADLTRLFERKYSQ